MPEAFPSAPRPTDPVPLVLLPGTLCDARLFAPLLERLGIRVPTIVGDMGLADTTADLARALLQLLPARFALLGFSLGGIIAMEMVAQAPARIERLALIDTTARPDPAANAGRRRRAAEAARKNGTDGYILDDWDRLVARRNRDRRDIRDTLLAMARTGGAETLARQSEVAIRRVDGRPRLARIAVPTLVLAGEEDAICPMEAHREIAAAVPGAVLAAIPHAGHFAPLEDPNGVARHVARWLCAERASERQAMEETI